MEKTLASSSIAQDHVGARLLDYLTENEDRLGLTQALLYYDFPLFRSDEDTLLKAHILIACPYHGVQIFATLGAVPSAEEMRAKDDSLSQLESTIFGKLIQSKKLRRNQRELGFSLSGFLIAIDANHFPEVDVENPLLRSYIAVDEALNRARQALPMPDEQWRELRAVLEGTKAIIRPKPRELPPSASPESKAAILAELETEIANFDAHQRRAAITIVDGPQRIRGLAGSGKTVVLAMKAAHIHLTNPDADILVTFYTKSLYHFIRRLITRFYRQFSDKDPDWSKIHVRHAWGGKSVDGVYYSAALDNGETPRTLRSVMGYADPFAYICEDLLKRVRIAPKYDYVLMDEAQDFPPSFYRLCFSLTRGGDYDRNVIWAYDELQNIINIKIASPREVFGTDAAGQALVDLDRAASSTQQSLSHDIVLYKCYRNPREILVCAHAMGFGIYSDTMVQALENQAHWEDLGYVVESGEVRVGYDVVVLRPEANSPLSISRRQRPDQLIKSFAASTVDEEVQWVAKRVKAILDRGLNPEDILVICLDDRNTKRYFQLLGSALNDDDIAVNNVLADPYSNPRFAIAGSVTLSTVYRAKGNEAAVVFAIGIDALFPDRKTQIGRNKLFTAFTRAKGWLRVSGVGPAAQSFIREVEEAVRNVPRLRFRQPDPAAIPTLQRDLNDKSSKMRKFQEILDKQLVDLELDPEEKEAFVTALLKR